MKLLDVQEIARLQGISVDEAFRLIRNLQADPIAARKRQSFIQDLRQVHIGRNEPCPCGSGKKFKKCCG